MKLPPLLKRFIYLTLFVLAVIYVYQQFFAQSPLIAQIGRQASNQDQWITFLNKKYTFKGAKNTVWSVPSHEVMSNLDQDIVITGIEYTIDNAPSGSIFDVCLNTFRNQGNLDYASVTGGYAEKLCFNDIFISPNDNNSVTQFLDLSQTPLYMPAGTNFWLGSTGFALPSNFHAQVSYSSKIKYHLYTAGEPRFASLRFPYFDEPMPQSKSMTPAYYLSSSEWPLRVKGFIVYDSFYGKGWSRACLRVSQQGGKVLQQVCKPDVNLPTQSTYHSSAKVWPVNWQVDIKKRDLLGGYCQFKHLKSNVDGDCAVWALVEIPNNLAGAEVAFRDYKNIPRHYLNLYCTRRVAVLNHPFFCNGAKTCSDTEKIEACNSGFPLSSIYDHPPTPTPSSSPTPTPTPTPTPNPEPLEINYVRQNNQITLDWSGGVNVAHYKIRIDWLDNAWNGNCHNSDNQNDYCFDTQDNSFSFKDIPTHTKNAYNIWIHSVDLNGVASKPVSITIPSLSPTPTPAPKPLEVSYTRTPDQITLDWSGGVNVAHYKIRIDWLGNAWNGACNNLDDNRGDYCFDSVGNSFTFKDMPTSNNPAYNIWVHSVDDKGTASQPVSLTIPKQ